MAFITETERVSFLLSSAAKAGMTMEEIILAELKAWETSGAREWMIKGDKYYRNETDILSKRRDNPKRHNAQLAHGFVRKLVDQRIGYLLAKPMSVSTEDTAYAEALNEIMDKAFRRTLMAAGREAVNKGIAWMQVYIDDQGGLRFKPFPSEELRPLWRDAAHTELDGMIRQYVVEAYEGRQRKDIVRVEYWDTHGVRRYVRDAERLIPDVELGDEAPHLYVGGEGHNWERVPFVAWKYNDQEQPLLALVKSLVDDYDWQRSTSADVLADTPNFVYVLKNFGGQKLSNFRRDLIEYGVIGVGDDGGVDKLAAELDTTAAEAHLTRSRKDIYEFGRGVDTQTVQLGNSPSGVALRFLYADLDMDCNMLETEFQASLEQVKWFVDTYLAITGKGDFRAADVDFVFNRDITINELEAIQMCKESSGTISEETILTNHPWVTDVEQEQARLKKQREEHMRSFGEDYTALHSHQEGGEDGVTDEDS